ncbi:DUF362 domain-containing protein [Candidatus Latescibacterota bacterium]
MERREFLQKTTKSGAIVAGIPLIDMASAEKTHAAQVALAAQVAETGKSGAKSIVAVCASYEKVLPEPAPINALLSTEQVRDVVWCALDRDTSPGRLKNIVNKSSWVVLKPNIVTIPLVQDDYGQGSGPNWNLVPEEDEGVQHWGLVTDLRVIKAVAEYLIEKIGPKRVTIAEGGVWFSSGGKLKPEEKFLDGWHVGWEGFGNLSYAGIADELNGKNGTVVDIIDLNEDEPVYVTDFDPHKTGRGAFQYVPAGYQDATSETKNTPRKGIYLPKTIMERDVLITIPVLKTHGSVGTTLFMKNFVGCVHSQKYVGGNHKVPIHKGNQYNLARGVADLASAINPEYGVAEGFWAATNMHHGQNGVNINHNVVICGSDVVAAESVANMAMGFNPLDFDLLRMCNMKGLGEWKPENIEINGPEIKSIRVNYARAQNKYTARGVRKWLMLGPVRKPLNEPGTLAPSLGGTVEKNKWSLLDGDAIMDSAAMIAGPPNYKDNLRYPIPGSEKARKGSRFYIAVNINTPRKDLVGQLLVGLEGGEFRAFLNGTERSHNNDPYRYDPTTSQFAKFHSGTNPLLIEVTKKNGKREPVKIAVNICDLDGDRLEDITFDPANE